MSDQFSDRKLKYEVAVTTTFDGVDEAANRGMIGTSEQTSKVRELDIDPKTGKKKKSLAEEILSLDAWQETMDDLLDQMNNKLDDLRQSLALSERLLAAQKEGNIAELRIILAEQGINVSNMNNEQILEATQNELELQTLKQETLIQEIQTLATEYKTNLQNENIPDDQKQIYAHKLAAMRLKAEGIANVDFDTAFRDSFELDESNGFYVLGNETHWKNYDFTSLSNGFNQKVNTEEEANTKKELVVSPESDFDNTTNPDLLSGLSFN